MMISVIPPYTRRRSHWVEGHHVDVLIFKIQFRHLELALGLLSAEGPPLLHYLSSHRSTPALQNLSHLHGDDGTKPSLLPPTNSMG